MNYFKLLNIKEGYDVDLDQLHQQYLSLQIIHHPDNITTDNKKDNISVSIDLNNAYKILKDEVLRAEYLLSLYSIDINAANFRTRLSAIELQNIWQNLEKVEEISDYKILELEYQHQQLVKAEILVNLTKAFADKQWSLVVDLTIRLKYLVNLINNIKFKINILCK
ncbi:Fe-S protein assembly co-chaperone HscB [Candidatus Trichorickettsia mobilis]|uniref:Fe-S protein assembly co-chaperone HscB n=1 Tax=Candidatus Trichorickettsia mobilis TaxID=1346319 RepID=UPI00292D34B3|nr:Fe-S protein assembly co-chaperone HscB [Candidatus Trichorickettsia mobilis]